MTTSHRDELTDTAATPRSTRPAGYCGCRRSVTGRRIAAAATRQQADYKGFLVKLLSLECDTGEARRKARLVWRGRLPPP